MRQVTKVFVVVERIAEMVVSITLIASNQSKLTQLQKRWGH